MGAAEFEHGKVPEAFAAMLDMEAAGKMTTGSLRYKCDVSRYGAKKYGITAAATMGFYYYCKTGDEKDVERIIKSLCNGDYRLTLKAPSLMSDSIDAVLCHLEPQVIGWVDIKNYWAVFLYEETRNQLVQLNQSIIKETVTKDVNNEQGFNSV